MRLLNDAEQKLIELGFKHAPIQCYKGVTDVDAREVMVTDPSGSYYLLGIDRQGVFDDGKNVLQLLFWGVEPCARAVADHLGWEIYEEESQMPVAEPNPHRFAMWQAKLRAPESMLVRRPIDDKTRRLRVVS